MADSAQNAPIDAAGSRTIPPRRRQSTITSLASSTVFAVQTAGTNLLNQDLPLGFFAAGAEAVSSAPTISEVRRRGSSVNVDQSRSSSGRYETTTGELQRGRFLTNEENGVTYAPLTEEPLSFNDPDESAQTTEIPAKSSKHLAKRNSAQVAGQESDTALEQYPSTPHIATSQTQPATENSRTTTGSSTWSASLLQFLKIFWRWFCTPFGFILTIYGLNIVAWGGMLFLLICNAAPAMCSQDTAENHFNGCNDINSPRRIWIETDSQILNALFCVTGCASKHGSIQERVYGLRVLAGIHRGWFRLPGHDTLDHTSTTDYLQGWSGACVQGSSDDPRVPLHRRLARRSAPSIAAASDESAPSGTTLAVAPSPISYPLTGIRAAPTKIWKLDFFIYCQIGNTVFQCCLCGFMWGMNRRERPSWSTGLFVALAAGISGVGGLVSWWEGRRVKKIEGEAPRANPDVEKNTVTAADLELQRTETDRESVLVGTKDGKPMV
ncbi:hypothetical protein K431DRAFT_328793 [Polychaeton citri CBS 116435]|uniref:Uncharacterized protein n=1 Tax=Polychaeton citri CBS 116435 TaxID=1314669 RepID=A0A9P4QAJ7_9PEZI|nr:hypothetical protein K431DRAFT_328793 [Polychaeton citri CBS 116435]